MKKFTTLLLVLALTLSTLLSVVPFGAFAETTTIEDLQVYDNSVTEDKGFRKKSSGAVTFSPHLPELKAAVDAGANIADYNAVLTITRLSEKGGEELATYGPIDCGKLTRSNHYYDILVKNFYPTPGAYYNITLEIYNGDTVAFVGTYSDRIATPDFELLSGYTPTDAEFNGEEDPDIPEITYPITIVDTATYRGFRKNSSGNILFCPYLNSTLDKDGSTSATDAVKKNAATYTASLDIFYQVGGNGSTELVEIASLTDVAIKSSSNGNYLDIELVKSGVDYGFCPAAGQYYTVELNIYDGNGDLVFCDGLYKNVSTYEVELSDHYYSVFYAGLQTGKASLRFIGGVSAVAVAAYDKVDLEITFSADETVVRSFTQTTHNVYTTLCGTNDAGKTFNAVTVKGSGVEAEETVNAAYLFGYGITGIPVGTYAVSITPVAYIGETAIRGKASTYTSITADADGTVTVTK